MSYIVIVLCHNEVHYIKLFESKLEAEEQAILLANEWYNKDGIKEFLPNQIETMDDMKSYYQSKSYFNSEDYVYVAIEEIEVCTVPNSVSI